MLIPFALLAALSSATVTVAINPNSAAFVGCVSEPPADGRRGLARTVESCKWTCSDTGSFRYSATAYSYFDSEANKCWCSDAGLDIGRIVDARPDGTCSKGYQVLQFTEQLVDKKLVDASFNSEISYKTCVDHARLDASQAESIKKAFTKVPNVASCFSSCKGKKSAVLNPSEDGFDCACFDDAMQFTAADDTICNAESYYLYSLSGAQKRGVPDTPAAQVKRSPAEDIPSPSQLASRKRKRTPTASEAARRKRRLEAEAEAAKPKTACPDGKRACRIRPDSDAHECVDTTLEAESCGGCPFGDVETEGLVKSGVDCTSLPNIFSKTYASCVAGKCQIDKCKLGYVLASDRSACGLNTNKFKRA